MAISRSTTPSCAWRSRSRCATCWSTARATSARSTAIRRGDAIHRSAHVAPGARAAGRHRQGNRRFRPELRRKRARAAGAAGARAEPAVNGSAGIAVGMATNIPPHNLTEVIAATDRADRRPDARHRRIDAASSRAGFPDLRHHQRRPASSRPIAPAAAASSCARKAEIEDRGEGRETIIITELPYQVNKARLIEKIAELVKEKKLEGISDGLRDESDKDGMRVVIESARRCRRGAQQPVRSRPSCR
jgi:hypothetical protein